MSDEKVTPIRPGVGVSNDVSLNAAPTGSAPPLIDEAVPTQKPESPVYDRFVSELAALECVLATLERWDLSGRPTGTGCQIGSAELTLRQTIARLHDLSGDVDDIETRAREVSRG
jgi:hypothetical protein